MEHYRIEYHVFRYSNGVEISLSTLKFRLEKKTPKGGWYVDDCGDRKWIADNGKKKYAYPTRELALRSLRARKTHHIKHLERQLREMKLVLKKTEKVLSETFGL
jgi:hypothetical protein